jgi:hypothetical protein
MSVCSPWSIAPRWKENEYIGCYDYRPQGLAIRLESTNVVHLRNGINPGTSMAVVLAKKKCDPGATRAVPDGSVAGPAPAADPPGSHCFQRPRSRKRSSTSAGGPSSYGRGSTITSSVSPSGSPAPTYCRSCNRIAIKIPVAIVGLEEAADGAHGENRDSEHHGHADHAENQPVGLQIEVVQSRSLWPVRGGRAT